jgi:hypothetical protein
MGNDHEPWSPFQSLKTIFSQNEEKVTEPSSSNPNSDLLINQSDNLDNQLSGTDTTQVAEIATIDCGDFSLSTLDELSRARTSRSVFAWSSFVDQNKPPLIHFGEKEKVVRISEAEWGVPENWFVLGDIHGDFYALINCLKYIHRTCPDFRLIFLGDLVDRGHHPMECLWILLAYAKYFPNRILWLAGNHDVAVQEQADKSFSASVLPSEFLDHLNKIDSWTPFRREFGREYIELVKDLPRAALFPDGMLVTHGGFPLSDLQKELSEKVSLEEKQAWLNSPQALQDFTWTRITRYPKRLLNRPSKGCSYGFQDFEAFCNATKDFFPVSRLVTGHDHPTNGSDSHPEWKNHQALTLKGYGFAEAYDHPEAFNSRYQDNLVVGRCRRNDIPEVLTIPVSREDLTQFFQQEIAPLFPASANSMTVPDSSPDMA